MRKVIILPLFLVFALCITSCEPWILPEDYFVTFVANGGDGNMDIQKYDKGESTALFINEFSRQGYIFNGWNTKADGSGTWYDDKQVITLSQNLLLYAQWLSPQVVSGKENEYDWVDLGLSVKWALCDIGADSPEEHGSLFAWGETEEKTSYTKESYIFMSEDGKLSKYNTHHIYGVCDKKVQLEKSDDVARKEWGGVWRMPTMKEQDELRNNCEYTYTRQNGVYGVLLKSKKNDNSIFFPLDTMSTQKMYWSSSLNTSKPQYAYYMNVPLTAAGSLSTFRYKGRYVRAVCPEKNTIFFDANGGTGEMKRQDMERGVSNALNPNTFVRQQYEFLAWNTMANGGGIRYSDEQMITLTQDVLLYAQWKRTDCILSFDANGGTGTMKSQSFQCGVPQNINANAFTREYYVFKEWNTKADGSGISYADEVSIALEDDMTLYAQWSLYNGEENNHEWIDLGLPSGVKWATCNLGANKPEEHGNYFAWGEIAAKSEYSWNTYKYAQGSNSKLTKYNTSSSYGTVDNKNMLESSDDAASSLWGGYWRMPTLADFEELKNNCEWILTIQNEVYGYKVVSKINGNSIFMPIAGYYKNNTIENVGFSGDYWSSSLNTSVPYSAACMCFSSGQITLGNSTREYGRSIRPVIDLDEQNSYCVSFDANGGYGHMVQQRFKPNSPKALSPNLFNRPGYKFNGWNTSRDGSGVSYEDEQVISVTNNMTLYARWRNDVIELGQVDCYSFFPDGYDGSRVTLPKGTILAQSESVIMRVGDTDEYVTNAGAYDGLYYGYMNSTAIDIQVVLRGGTNPKNASGLPCDSTATIPAQGCFIEIEAAADGYIWVFHKASSHKTYLVAQDEDLIGYDFAMHSGTAPWGEILKYKLRGNEDNNIVTDPSLLIWPEKIVLGDEWENYATFNESSSERRVAISGMGVIRFPVYEGHKYTVNACGSKIATCGYLFYHEKQDVYMGDEATGNKILLMPADM